MVQEQQRAMGTSTCYDKRTILLYLLLLDIEGFVVAPARLQGPLFVVERNETRLGGQHHFLPTSNGVSLNAQTLFLLLLDEPRGHLRAPPSCVEHDYDQRDHEGD